MMLLLDQNVQPTAIMTSQSDLAIAIETLQSIAIMTIVSIETSDCEVIARPDWDDFTEY